MLQFIGNYLLIIISLSLTLTTKAQKQGYIVKDSIYIQGYLNHGADLLSRDSIKFAKTFQGHYIKFFPKDLQEYGFVNGNVYFRKDIGDKQYFLRRLVIGNIKLYIHKIDGKKYFYFEKNKDPITLIDPDSFRQQLSDVLQNCSGAKDLTKLVYYNQQSLPRIIKYYNKCSDDYFPYTRFGVILGNSSRKLNVKYRAFELSFKDKLGITIGAYVDIPIGIYTKWSTRLELLYKSHKFSLHQANSVAVRDFAVDLSTINLPILLRYRSYKSSILATFDMGTIFGYNLKKNVTLTETVLDSVTKNPVTSEQELDIIDKMELGAVLGLGLEFPIDKNRAVGVGVRYQFTFALGSGNNHTVTDLQLLASFVF